jgi:predicted MFS family arabinose efflux permease
VTGSRPDLDVGTRRILLAIEMAFGAVFGTVSLSLPAVAREARLDNRALGWVLLLEGLGALGAVGVAGRLIERFGDGWCTGASLVVIAGGLSAFGLSRDVVEAGVALVVVGVGAGVLDIGVISSINRTAVAPIAHAHGCFSIGVVVASVIAGVAFDVGASAIAVLGTAAAILIGLAIEMMHRFDRAPLPPSRAIEPVLETGLAREPQSLLLPAIFIAGVLCSLSYLIESSWQSWSAIWLERGLSARPIIAGLAPALFDGAAAAARISLGRRGNQAGPSKVLRFGGLGAALGVGLTTATSSSAVALGGLALTGASVGLLAPTLVERTLKQTDNATRADALARMSRTAYLGMLFGPSLVGEVAAGIGLRRALFGLAIVCLVLATGGAALSSRLDAPRAGVAERAPFRRFLGL